MRVLLETLDQLLDLGRGHRATRRIAGAVEDDQARLRRHLGQHLVGAEGELVGFTQRNRDGLGAGVLDHRAIDGKARIGVHDFRAGLAEHQDGKEHRRLAAGHDDDEVGIDFDAVTAVQVLGDGLTQGQNTVRGRVAVMAVTQRFDRGFHDMARRLEIRLANP